MNFTNEQLERYSRQISLREIGIQGQEKLAAASVLIIGAGGLGSPAAMYLAASGVGRIGIVDPDTVDLSNLQRQIIHRTRDIGRQKVDSAGDTMREINPHVDVQTYPLRLSRENIFAILEGYDFILDCTDNFAAKYLINDACVMAGKPFTHGGILRFSGQLMTVIPHVSPCYRCVFDAPPDRPVPTGREVGILGAVAGIVGTLQALEAIKYITGAGELLAGRLLTFDALTMEFFTARIPGLKEGCPACGAKEA